ncbi:MULTISPECIES: hypothetical protein [unclassified Amycolatopsis]|uniref:hypothetical protein n=1 Tax=unclassified Amycolatopsis TaxID=2618356 RepID=UPI001C6A8BB4|nr:hypothetical protein [Amycolatopsis sp. DSM 110486]QYN22277.1 hypothetical protein K1T34_07260 [Amycolatopsis sp. DSM 110486]
MVTITARGWSVHVGDTEVVFGRTLRPGEGEADLPRVWAGRGLGLRDEDVPAFVAALGEVMATSQFWHARGSGAGRGSEQIWSVPLTRNGFTYVTGPCGRWNNTAGHRPVETVSVALADVRGLRIRLAAHLHTG